ncbi:MAG: hypothetical protein M8349_08545 [ANME-2 cluster archaeon]|nr:hypothetical protein [ANME-2 cluster archaeon]MDF1557697.1 hypothetical protein [ANME-2 cluster archaeon]
MNRKIILFLSVLVVSLIMAGCLETREKAPLSTPEIRTAIDTKDSFVILFFYDPSMGTSQEQLEILYDIKQNHSDSVILLPYAMDNPESFDAKEGYRVRSTPTTVVIDDEGYIVKTFTKITFEKMIEELILQDIKK